MANIPIEPTRRSNLLPILLGALVALALLFFVLRGCDNDGQPGDVGPVGSDNGIVNPDSAGPDGTSLGAMAGNAFSSVDDIFADSVAMPGYAGREVTLTNAAVTNVVGDSTFYVQTADGRNRIFVVLTGLGESQTTGGSADGQQSIKDGDRISLRGTLENGDFSRYGMNPEDLARAQRTGLMLRATRVTE